MIDNGPTLGWKSGDDHRIRRAVDVASTLISTLPRTSRIGIVDRSANPPVFSLDVSGALSKLEKVRPVSLARPLRSRVQSAVRLLGTSDLSNHQLVIITDLAGQAWKQPTGNATGIEPFDLDQDLGINLFDLGEFNGVNHSLAIPKLSDGTPSKNVPVSLSTILSKQHLGGENLRVSQGKTSTITVELQLYENSPSLPVIRDGEVVYPQRTSVDRTSVTITDDGSSEVVLSVPGLPTGNHLGRIEVVGGDSLSVDNLRYFTVNVMPSSSVLLVCDRVKEASVIESTLSVASTEVAAEDAEFQVQRISFKDFPVAVLDGFDSILMIDPPFEAFEEVSLQDYYRKGGNILACLGPDFGQAEEVASQTVGHGVLPHVLRRWRVPQRGTFLQVMREQHSSVETLAGDTPWDQFPVSQYWQIEPAESDSVIIRYAGTDHPALIERAFSEQAMTGEVDANGRTGDGKLMLLTTPLPALASETRSWNRLFGTDPWPAWLLTRQVIEHLAGRRANPATMTIGSPITIPLPDEAVELPSRLQWFPPDGQAPVPIEISDAVGEVSLSGVDTPGAHWIRGLPDTTGFTANLPQKQLDLTRIGETDLDVIFGTDRFRLVTSVDQMSLSGGDAASRVSLASPAMLFAFFVFLVEQVLANRFYKRV